MWTIHQKSGITGEFFQLTDEYRSCEVAWLDMNELIAAFPGIEYKLVFRSKA